MFMHIFINSHDVLIARNALKGGNNINKLIILYLYLLTLHLYSFHTFRNFK